MLKNTYLVTFLLVAIASQGFGQVTGKTAPASGNAKKSTPLVKKTIASKSTEIPAIPASVAIKDPILMTIGGDPVTQGEFESIYRKNNPKDAPNDRKALEEYLELFVNFKLKVKAAKDIGKDTAKAFINELKGYRRQLAQPYLTDKEVNEKLIDEAYQRMKKDVKASHILFKLPNDPLPKDTLLAYNKAITVRNRAVKGESFDALAKEFSDDPSAKQNGGDLGYFTSMMMVYPFESVAYKTPVNEVSMPVRTKFGYHIIKVADIRDAQGQVHVAHIMVRIPENAKDSVVASSEKKIREIYEKVKAGEDFTQLASTYSDDRTSGKNGGVLPWFGPGKMVPEFEKVAFDLKNDNDISEPVKTQYGFHIIKRLERKGIQTFDEVKGDLKQKITKDSRSQVSRNAVISRVKKENNFTEDTKALDELITKVDTSYLNGKWSVDKAAGLNKKLFSIGNEVSSQADFAKYLADNQSKQNKDLVVEAIIRKTYEAYSTDKVIAFEDARLEQKYPEFRMLMQEYRDGILLFEITDENVWSKAIKDSSGLSAFHNENASKYMWNQRADAVIYKAKDAKLAKATRKLVAKRVKKGLTTDAIKKEINATSELNLQTEEALFSKGDNETIDKLPWVAGITADQIGTDGTVTFVEFRKILEPQPKSLQEAKGLITADYQTFLEQKWIKELKAKYKVDIDRAVFDTIH